MAVGAPLSNDVFHGLVHLDVTANDGADRAKLGRPKHRFVAENDDVEEETGNGSSDDGLEDDDDFDEDFDEDFEELEYDLEEMEDDDVEKLNGRSCGINLDE